MSKKKIYYKVVDENLNSCVVYAKARVKYSKGKWVHAPKWLQKKGYHLLVFTDLKYAKYFCGAMAGESKIYSCYIRSKIQRKPSMMNYLSISRGNMSIPLGINAWPIGTIMVKEVMLLKEVKE